MADVYEGVYVAGMVKALPAATMRPLPLEVARERLMRPSRRGYRCYWCHAPLAPNYPMGTAAGFCSRTCKREAAKAGLP